MLDASPDPARQERLPAGNRAARAHQRTAQRTGTRSPIRPYPPARSRVHAPQRSSRKAIFTHHREDASLASPADTGQSPEAGCHLVAQLPTASYGPRRQHQVHPADLQGFLRTMIGGCGSLRSPLANLKTGNGASRSWVRIPPPPPVSGGTSRLLENDGTRPAYQHRCRWRYD